MLTQVSRFVVVVFAIGFSALVVSGQTPVFEDLLTDTSKITGQWTSQYTNGGIFSANGYTLTQSTRFGGVDSQGSPRSEDYIWYDLPGVCSDGTGSIEFDVKGLYPSAGVVDNQLMWILDKTKCNGVMGNPATTSNDAYESRCRISFHKENEIGYHVNSTKITDEILDQDCVWTSDHDTIHRNNDLSWDGATTYRFRVTWSGVQVRFYRGVPGQTLTLLATLSPCYGPFDPAIFHLQLGSSFRAGPRNIQDSGGAPGTLYSLMRIYEEDIGGVATPLRPGTGPPIIAEFTPDPDSTYSGVEYVRQLTIIQGSLPISWSVVQGPTGTAVDSSGLVNGWIPDVDDIGQLFAFEIQATNSQGADTESWQVRVEQSGQGSKVISAVPDSYTEIRLDADIDMLTFHAAGSVELVNNAFNNNEQYGKPIVISDDGQFWSMSEPDNMHAALQAALAHGGHFEHLDLDITDREETGLPVNGIEDFSARSIEHLQYLSQHSQSLSYPGTLTRSGNKLYWNGQETHLVGFSDYGPVATDLVNIQGYLDVLASYNVNFTRIFALDRWSNQGCNYTPFRVVSGGQPPCRGSKFDITQPDDSAYFTRLRQFVTYAAQKGIVVQLCIFDRCGLQSGDQWRWPANPYNVANNINTRFTLDGSNYPPAFTNTTGDVAVIHSTFLNKIVNTVGDCGNVIYEIMNEPINAFPNTPAFHAWVADTLIEAFGNIVGTSVFIDLGTIDDEQGLSRVVVGDGDTVAEPDVGGRDCRRNDNPNEDFYVYFNVDDGFAYQGSNPNLCITIDYYDTGSGALELEYDSPGDQLSDQYKSGGAVMLTGTDTWKQHTYHLTDAYFGNRQNGGADFRISGGVGNTFYLDIVEVREPPGIGLSIASIDHSIEICNDLPNDSFTVGNIGSGTLNYTITDDVTWLSVSPDGGTSTGEMDVISIIYETAELVAGDYSCVIIVEDPGAFNSPQTITVNLHVYIPGDLDLDGDVDQEDFGYLQACYTGTGIGYGPECSQADLDSDKDIDLEDLNVFQSFMGGADKPPGC